MKILASSNYFPEHIGGIERVAGDLVHALRAKGHSVRWVAAETSEHPHRGNAEDAPVPAWNVTERRLGFPYPIPDPRCRHSLEEIVDASDVVHLHDCLYATNLMIFRAARKLGRPVVITQHVTEVPYRRWLLRTVQREAYRRLTEPMLSRADRVVFVSERVRARFADVVVGLRSEVIENGVDVSGLALPAQHERSLMREQFGYHQTDTVLLFAGRFVEKKGLVHIRTAAAARPLWRWLLVGRVDDEDPREWRLPNVTVLDPVGHERMGSLYMAADLLVLPSSGEGLPVVVQEALISGTPVLTTVDTGANLAGHRGMVRGWDPATGPLASAIDAALRQPEDPHEIALHARHRWDLNDVAIRYEALMQTALDAPRRTHQTP
ncbi:MAG: glycosyltransferase family 4 protein [Candidatus Dormibacteria bacterium]